MTLRRFLNVLFALTLLLSLSAELIVAQGSPRPEEPGVTPGAALSLPPGPLARVDGMAPAAAFSDGPAYDSGWIALSQDESKTLTHNVGGSSDDYVVDMQFEASGSDGINQRYYGGADFGVNPAPGHNPDDRVGAYWRSLNNSTVVVYRRPEDTYAERVRLRIWVDAAPDWDSGWISLVAGAAATTLDHNLGGSADDYVVDMEYRSASNGVNQRYYGGADFGAFPAPGHSADDRVGLYWRSLTNASITLFRRDEDDYADDVRVRIWVRPDPTYDSGWVAINQDQAQTWTHNIGGNAEAYLVDMQFRSIGSGVNQRHLGGADFGATPPAGMNPDDRVGAYWRSLDTTSITVYRRPNDIYAQEMRIRIWVYPYHVYLPVVLRSY